MKFASSLLDFFLPRFCASCNTKLPPDEHIVCNNCFSKIKRADEDRINAEFTKKFAHDKIISSFTSLFIFEKDKELQSIIHELKYGGKFGIGKYLGEIIARELNQQIRDWRIDLIVPVPLHHLKRAERGYNQSDFLAKGISSVLKIPVKSRIVKRVRFTSTQTELTLVQRKENVRNAFALRGKPKLNGQNILLLDDVITTGATTSECAKVLVDNGAKKVYACSVAIAE